MSDVQKGAYFEGVQAGRAEAADKIASERRRTILECAGYLKAIPSFGDGEWAARHVLELLKEEEGHE